MIQSNWVWRSLAHCTRRVGAMFLWKFPPAPEENHQQFLQATWSHDSQNCMNLHQCIFLSCFGVSWALETSQADTTLLALMYILCMCFATSMNTHGLIFNHGKNYPCLLLASDWIECKTATTLIGRRSNTHPLLPHFHEPSLAFQQVLHAKSLISVKKWLWKD